jgi:hypothetical protein
MPTHKRACRLAGAVAAALSASAASAEIFPATTIAGVYQQSTTTCSISPPADTGCANTPGGGDFVFSRVPSGKQLIVSNVSCTVTVSAGFLSLIQLVSQRPNGDIPGRAQNLQPAKSEGTQYFLNNTTLAAFDSRERPLVRLNASTFANISGLCSIAGQLTDAPP